MLLQTLSNQVTNLMPKLSYHTAQLIVCLMTAIATGLKTGSLTLSLSYHMHNTALSCVKHPESTHSTDYGRVDSSIVLDIDILDFQIIGACHK